MKVGAFFSNFRFLIRGGIRNFVRNSVESDPNTSTTVDLLLKVTIQYISLLSKITFHSTLACISAI